MKQVITNQQEIEKYYFINVAQANGLIHLDMNDFYRFADNYKQTIEIIIDSPEPLSAQVETALAEIRSRGIEKYAAILSISHKPSYPLMMKELESTDSQFDSKIVFKRGIKEDDGISNNRSISLYIFY